MKKSEKMKVGIFVTAAFCKKRYLDAISGHVQIPLMAAKILADAGYQVTLVTTRPQGGDVLPKDVLRNVSIYVVEHASRPWPENGIYWGKALKQTWQLFAFFKKESFSIIHFFGGSSIVLSLSCLKYLGIKSQALFTPIKRANVDMSSVRSKMMKVALERIDKIITMTNYVRDGWASLLGPNKVMSLHTGVMKEIPESSENTTRNSVLFWRNAGYENGADLAIEAFRELAPKYPDIHFVFAVRPHDRYERELRELEKDAPNIEVHLYPYVSGVSLATFLHRALFVVQPFRSLSVNPQMSILETLYAGVPVIATKIESNEELIKDGQNGFLIPVDDKNALTCAIERLLEDRKLVERLRKKTRAIVTESWNWESFEKGLFKIYEKHSQ